MPDIFNIYCDESCHLENDQQRAMVLGAIWCPTDKVREATICIREIKKNSGLKPDFETKWTKVSPGKLDYYLKLVDYFFSDNNLHFRALIVPDKSKLQHDRFNQDHNTFYYKMYFDMLKVILDPKSRFNIYLDIKDTKGALKVKKLHEVLCNNIYDFERQIIERVQTVRSHEVELLQLTDLLIGAVSYVNRNISSSGAKIALIEHIKRLSHYSLTRSTLLMEKKFNIFRWEASEAV